MGEHLGVPADKGLQQERTVLAWRRTGLSLIVAALVIARLAAVQDANAAVGVAVLATVLAVWSVLLGSRVGRASAPSLREPAFDRILYDGMLPAVLTATVVLLCVAETMLVL